MVSQVLLYLDATLNPNQLLQVLDVDGVHLTRGL